ncbi:hypothetical protein HYALB_00011853 [Hymenoscyphus albidus]|uniref:Heterokaryon incompatibility domain-containing protein n=1 Tax=Hymenoscyphus albidus TaxID=595503 RepID=A0A9N9LW93_9HELO|nr:hypothetical protein HYALB_00011853 [Hymenoscyphus albidus]
MELESRDPIVAMPEHAVLSDSTESWTTADLCEECAAFNMDSSKDRHFSSKEMMYPKCPLCHFVSSCSIDHGPAISVQGAKLGHSEADKRDANFFEIVSSQWESCYIFPTCPANTVGNHQQTYFRTLRQESIDYSVLRNWVSHCDSSHSPITCLGHIGDSKQIRDLMLINCNTREIVKTPKKNNCRYVWGNSDVVPEPTPHCGKLPIQMPDTLEDSLRVVLELELDYLWIDKYCIDQLKDSEKQHQILHMNKIYSSAHLTIITAAGHDSAHGLPGVGNRPRSAVQTFELNGVTWTSSGRSPRKLVKASTWRTRAWTYQEGLFSTRRLIFTDEQVFFECNMWQARENIHFGRSMFKSELLFRNGVNNLKAKDFWHHIRLYSGGNLTDQNDAINGLRGLLMAFSQLANPVHTFWGVPLNDPCFKNSSWNPSKRDVWDVSLGYALLWRLMSDGQRRDNFPSWSWAGWRGVAGHYIYWGPGSCDEEFATKFWFMRRDSTPERLSEGIIARIAADPTIESRDYKPVLRIEAWVMEINVGYWDKSCWAVATSQLDGYGTSTTLRWHISMSLLESETPERNEGLLKGKFECLIFSKSEESYYGLVLRKVDNGNRERAGIVILKYGPHRAWCARGLNKALDLRNFFPCEQRTIIFQ